MLFKTILIKLQNQLVLSGISISVSKSSNQMNVQTLNNQLMHIKLIKTQNNVHHFHSMMKERQILLELKLNQMKIKSLVLN